MPTEQLTQTGVTKHSIFTIIIKRFAVKFLYNCCGEEALHTCILLQRRRMASTGGRGSTSCSIFTQLRRIMAASVVEVAMTMPGQSRSLMCLSKCTCWRHLKSNKPFRRPEGNKWVSVFWALTWWRREWRQHCTRVLVSDCWSNCSFPRLGSLPGKAAKHYVTLHDSNATRVKEKLTHNTHSNGGLYVLVATVVPEMFHQAVCADTSAAAEKLCGRLCHRHVAAFLFVTKRYKCAIFCRGFGF